MAQMAMALSEPQKLRETGAYGVRRGGTCDRNLDFREGKPLQFERSRGGQREAGLLAGEAAAAQERSMERWKFMFSQKCVEALTLM